MSERELLRTTAEHAADFLDTLETRSVDPSERDVDVLHAALGGPLPEDGLDPRAVVESLVEHVDAGLNAMPSGRFFGFVIGGALPAALAADWLTSTWDQNTGLYAPTPAAAVVEDVCRGWLLELLGLPAHASAAFVTGCQMAHVTALAAARHHVLAAAGWDVARSGLAGAPRLRVVVGAKRHGTVDLALRLLGIGGDGIEVVPCDDQGRMRVDVLKLDATPTIVCAQAGEINTGAFDDLDALADLCAEHGAWLHVDGAFGLWAAAALSLRHLLRGHERADSWATDAHKLLNVPYDSGLAFCAHPESHRAATSMHADYLLHAEDPRHRDPSDWTPELSRRARAFPIYAAIRSLGRKGVADLVERSCAHARRFASALEAGGATILNEVVLNQVLVRFGDGDYTREVVERVQREGTCWPSGTSWEGEYAMRISVCNWRTTDAD
ncbi:MAG TPA: pyridoxal-dependent decarboxylase, partial [Gaiellaceae bacterium]|nr:pyridoxal-dependent decarboxylase [Gaiellaceae bacterium]